MAIAVAPLTAGKFNIGNKKVRMADVTFTGSYATGGEAITPGSVGMKRIMNVLGNVTEAAGQTTNWQIHWDAANMKAPNVPDAEAPRSARPAPPSTPRPPTRPRPSATSSSSASRCQASGSHRR